MWSSLWLQCRPYSAYSGTRIPPPLSVPRFQAGFGSPFRCVLVCCRPAFMCSGRVFELRCLFLVRKCVRFLIGALRERSYHSADRAQDAWAVRVNQREGMDDGSGNTRGYHVGMFWTVVADERAQKLQGSYGGRYKLAILDAYLLGVYRWYCGQILLWIHKLGAGGVFYQPCMPCRELGGLFPQQEARCGRGGGETSGRIGWFSSFGASPFLSPIRRQIQGERRFLWQCSLLYFAYGLAMTFGFADAFTRRKNHGRKERPRCPSA